MKLADFEIKEALLYKVEFLLKGYIREEFVYREDFLDRMGELEYAGAEIVQIKIEE